MTVDSIPAGKSDPGKVESPRTSLNKQLQQEGLRQAREFQQSTQSVQLSVSQTAVSNKVVVTAMEQNVVVNERLKGIDLTSKNFTTVLVDPPRAGLDPDTLAMISQFEHIIYISCNPNTLVDNLSALSKTHEVTRAALFDQFPFTDHMESGVFLRRKK